RRECAGGNVSRRPPVLRALPSDRDQRRAAGRRERQVSPLHQGWAARLGARVRSDRRDRVRAQGDLLRRAPDLRRDRPGLPGTDERERLSAAMDEPRVVVKKRRGPRTPYYGGAWKVAYADFVTAMMAVFIVLWLFTQTDTRLRHQIAQYFRDPGVLPTGAAKSRDPVRVMP